MKTTKNKITKLDLAQMHGVSEGSISRWMRNGCPYEHQTAGCRRLVLFDPEAVNEWIKTRPAAGRKPKNSATN